MSERDTLLNADHGLPVRQGLAVDLGDHVAAQQKFIGPDSHGPFDAGAGEDETSPAQPAPTQSKMPFLFTSRTMSSALL